MDHPLISDISHLTLEELGAKVSELQKKLNIAQRTGNGYLTNQVRMALETYYNRYQYMLQENYKKSNDATIDFDSKIDIK
jgi:hypothetical protein